MAVGECLAALQELKQLSANAIGCSDLELEDIATRLGHPLPTCYRTFLEWFGHTADQVFVGQNCQYDQLSALREGAQATAEEVGRRFPDDALVFWGHQGYRFFYFRSTDEDPLVQVIEDSPVDKPYPHTLVSDFLAFVAKNALEVRNMPSPQSGKFWSLKFWK